MKLIISKIITIWVQVRDLYLYLFQHAIIVNGYVDDHTWCGIRHMNWGDDLNYYYLHQLTRRPIVFRHNFRIARWLRHNSYLCIGTLLDGEKYKDSHTVIWGSGCSGADRALTTPQKVLAVRGPKSREYLQYQGIDCPEVYGDPALLLPLVYQPPFYGCIVPLERVKCKTPKECEKDDSFTRAEHNYTHESAVTHSTHKYALGIIPHVVDLHHPVIEEIREKHADEILIIDLAHYKKWTDVIDQICSCERILSSSLHGLIVSDAYQVPSCWIELTGKISGGYFKYLDYAASVNRIFSTPILIESFAVFADVVEHADSYFSCAEAEKIKELQQGLVTVAPFECFVLGEGEEIS